MSASDWEYMRNRIRAGASPITCRVNVDSGIPGTALVQATVPEVPAPVGVIWWRHQSGTVEILNCWTDNDLRRVGIFRALLKKLAAEAKLFEVERIRTDDASEHGGLDALKACGFKQLKSRLGWEVRVSRVLAL